LSKKEPRDDKSKDREEREELIEPKESMEMFPLFENAEVEDFQEGYLTIRDGSGAFASYAHGQETMRGDEWGFIDYPKPQLRERSGMYFSEHSLPVLAGLRVQNRLHFQENIFEVKRCFKPLEPAELPTSQPFEQLLTSTSSKLRFADFTRSSTLSPRPHSLFHPSSKVLTFQLDSKISKERKKKTFILNTNPPLSTVAVRISCSSSWRSHRR
jgi:hypothetical protein